MDGKESLLDDATVSSSRGSAKSDFLELLNNRRSFLMICIIGLLYRYHCRQSWILLTVGFAVQKNI
jgi:hypothetical protein